MVPITGISEERVSKLSYILCDIDDTVTTNGKLPAAAYSAMWDLFRAGFHVIPVTGRPAGWCDLIIREWPVKAVVGENGAFVHYFENGHLQTFLHPSVASAEIHDRLEAVKQACLKGVPGSRIAKDQPYRQYDLAIDFNEDPPYLGLEAAEKIKNICISMGAEAKISSIHVNAWFGKYDKLTMTELFLQQVFHETEIKEKVMFFGDSPNDEPMFAYFPNSCAVANIKPFLHQLSHLPAFVTSETGGEGFAEAIAHLLSLR